MTCINSGDYFPTYGVTILSANLNYKNTLAVIFWWINGVSEHPQITEIQGTEHKGKPNADNY